MIKPLIGIGSDVAHKQGERDRAFVYTTYVDSLRRAGAVPVLVPPQPENAAEILDDLDGLLLAGGDDCDPAVYGEQPHASVDPMDPRQQAIGRVAGDLRVTAHAPDGVVEGLEDPAHPFYLGVQWHPEDMPREESAASLFGAFVAAARKYSEQPNKASTEMSPLPAGRP